MLLRIRHGTTPDTAKARVLAKLQKTGYARQVRWEGFIFSANVGFGTLLALTGHIGRAEIVVEHCVGLYAQDVLTELEKMAAELAAA